MKQSKIKLLILGLVTLSACSSASVRVMPNESGVHKIVARDITKEGAEEAANEAAHDFCKDRNMIATFEAADSKYEGKMDETSRNTVRKMSTVLSMSGQPNGTASTAGRAGLGMTNDKDYTAEVSFKCK